MEIKFDGFAIIRDDGHYAEFGHALAVNEFAGGPDKWLETKIPTLPFTNKYKYRVVPATLTIEEKEKE